MVILVVRVRQPAATAPLVATWLLDGLDQADVQVLADDTVRVAVPEPARTHVVELLTEPRLAGWRLLDGPP